jgi:hypothetical protein
MPRKEEMETQRKPKELVAFLYRGLPVKISTLAI